jgi:hypothetical protein
VVEIVIGRGRALQDHLDVSGLTPDKYNCNNCLVSKNPHFECIPHNGTMTVNVMIGITRSTVDEFKKDALCCKEVIGR